MTASKYYAVTLHPNTPKELLALLDLYLHTPPAREDGSSPGLYVYCLSILPALPFLELELVANRADSEPWKVQIPVACILAIADMSGRRTDMGFRTA